MSNLVNALRRYKEPVPDEAADRIEELEAAQDKFLIDHMTALEDHIEVLEATLRERDEELVIYHAFLSEAFPNGAKLNFSVEALENARAALGLEPYK